MIFRSFWQGMGSDGDISESTDLDVLISNAQALVVEKERRMAEAYPNVPFRTEIWISQDDHHHEPVTKPKQPGKPARRSLGGWTTHRWRYICIVRADSIEWITPPEEIDD